MNTYQKTYSRFILNLYFECKNIGMINCQVINNIYNIKMNSVKIPDLDNKDIIVKAHIMIEFMKNTKSNNNILKSSDSKHPNVFYSYIDYDNSPNSKVKVYTTNLNNIKYNNEIEELLVPIHDRNSENNDNNQINNSFSNSFSETEETDSIKENENSIISAGSIGNELIVISACENEKNEDNKQRKDNKNNQTKENISKAKDKIPSIKQVNEDLNNNKKYLNENSINIEKEKVQLIKDKNNNNELMTKKKVEESSNIIKKNKDEGTGANGYKEIRREVNPNERIKKYIFTSLPEVCEEEVEYRDDIKFEYIDKKNKKINCSYYGEFKKGTLKRHGRGLFLWSDGEFYLGYWANDKREGKGTNTYSNGNIYNGEYKNGKKDGQGEFKWNNGDMYKGSWKNDMKDGKGVYTFSNGDIYDGYFKMDKIDRDRIYTRRNKNGNKFINKNGIYGYKADNNDNNIKTNKK